MKILDKQDKWLLFNRHGITLTELVVASVMIGIVMVGVASFGSSVKRFQSSTSKSAILAMKTKAVMARITDDAYKAIGDFTDEGVVLYINGNFRSICFRQDVNITPENYADDDWICYMQTSGANRRLFLCAVPTPQARVPVQNNDDCNAGPGNRELILILDPSQPAFAQIITDIDNRIEYIEIALATIHDRTIPVHPITNPQYLLTQQISPPGHSR